MGAPRARAVALSVDNGWLDIVGEEITRRVTLGAAARFRLAHGARLVTLPDGVREIRITRRSRMCSAAAGHRDSLSHGKAAGAERPAALGWSHSYSSRIAGYCPSLPNMPRSTSLSWEQGLGQEAIVFLEKRFSATELPIERRDGLTRRFEAIAPEDGRDYEIRYRARRSGRMRSRYPAA